VIILKKALYNLLIVVCLFYFGITNVSASGYEMWDLIPIDTVASVETENFKYNEFYYKSSADINGYTSIEFSSIENLSSKKLPVSISVGLFNSDKENIGVINYCSLADKSSSYSGAEISSGEKSAFSIKIKPDKYNSTDSDLSDVKYITIMDDNKYCKTGGAYNYVGLDVDQMKNGITNKQLELNESTKQKQLIINITIVILTVVIGYMIFGSVVSSLYTKMFSVWTAFSYVPIINNYLSFKMSFGPMVAKILTGIMVLCLVIGLFGVKLFMYVSLILVLISLVVNIIKLLTSRFGLFYYGETDFTNGNNVSYVMNDRERMSASNFTFNDTQNIEEDNFNNVSSENPIVSSVVENNMYNVDNTPVPETNINNVVNINNNVNQTSSDLGFNMNYNNAENQMNNDGMIDISQSTEASLPVDNSNDMQVFDIDLNEKQDISYTHTSTEYFDMANEDTLSQFENASNSVSGDMSLTDFNALDDVSMNEEVGENNPTSIIDEFSNENTFNNTDQNDSDSSNNEDTDLTRFFS